MAGETGLRRRRLYLVRHGHVSYFGAQGQPLDPRTVRLSADGETQVAALRQVLADVVVDRAVSSDYPRAQQTLEMVLSQPPRAGAPEHLAALREVKAGRLREIPIAAYGAEVNGAYGDARLPDTRFLRGEPWDDFSDRVLGWFRAFLAEPNWQDAIVASHDAVNRILIGWLLSGDRTVIASLEQDAACLNIVDVDCRADGTVDAAFVRLLNFTPYNITKKGDRLTVMDRIAQSMLAM
ncbi:histidine phosphatase family protein [Hydrocarboniclastica marina]|uniref:Histidine phosphatase family protein n=1 Tax=Hydrocarboniclastica marina TaxID=2259620 RepID=A0A4P7XK52_9ALTE|nr:histidine phosphatase family protein [Hydrocarboniclastica marina]QCF27491.1 histidine phosphatase family protein [Hydrocarboniclastica marina]